MPDASGKPPANTSNCLLCHGPPKGAIDVAGKPFVHADYVERGVACTECHNPVIEGNGKVGRERCHACHGEVGHVERIGETAFLHDKHVSQHKVECFECHDEIRHGLLPLVSSAAPKSDGCGACHVEPHDAARSLYSGRGAVGVADRPSRMFVSRVVCESCHTGRTGFAATPRSSQVEGAAERKVAKGHGHDGVSRVAAASEADCIHCHGTAFAGMLAEWRGAVGGELDRLRPLIVALGTKIEAASDAEARRLHDEAWQNFELVDLDGSRGVHNPAYALAALRVAAERIDAASLKLDPAAPPAAASGLPPAAASENGGCSNCHVAPQLRRVVVHGRPFSHEKHLGATGLTCGECHDAALRGQPGHGQPKFDRRKCAACHHQESDQRDVTNCAACHAAQETMVRGTVAIRRGDGAGLDAPKPGPMGKMECNECHGDAPDILRPKPAACVLCHKQGYDKMQRE